MANPTTAVGAADICAGTLKVPIHAFKITASGGAGSGVLTNFQFTTTGTYVASEIVNFKIWKNTVDDLSTATELLAAYAGTPPSTNNTPLGPGLQVYSGTGGPSTSFRTFSYGIPNTVTWFFWITMDVAATVTDGSTIGVIASVNTDMTTAKIQAGSAAASGTQTLHTFPVITVQPADQSICTSSLSVPAAFNVTATAGSGLTYQWYENAVLITNGGIYSGATSAALTLTGVNAGMNGYLYTCVTSTAFCSTTSSAASLNVPALAPTRAVTQNNISGVLQGTNYNEIIGIEIDINCATTTATSFILNTTGSTAPGTDISAARLLYTGTSSIFTTSAPQFGIQASPSGTFTITGTQSLSVGTNYFWLSYDVPLTAVLGDVLDGQCTSITIGGTGTAPSPTTVAGSRPIVAVNSWLWAQGAVGDGTAFEIQDILDCAIDASNSVYTVGYFKLNVTFGSTPTLSAPVGYSPVIVKYDAGGNALWARMIGNAAGGYVGSYDGVAVSPAGWVYAVGNVSAGTTFGPFTATMGGMVVMVYDANGNEAYMFPQNTNTGTCSGSNLAVDASDNVYVTGYYIGAITIGGLSITSSNGGTQTDVFVVKYDGVTGNPVWLKSIGGGGGGAHGVWFNTYVNDAMKSIAVDASGNVFVGGYSAASSPLDVWSGEPRITAGAFTTTSVQQLDFFLVKYNSSGTEQWMKQPTSGTGGGNDMNKMAGLALDASGNVYITGSFAYNLRIGTTTLTNTGAGGNPTFVLDVFVAKYNNAGTFQWAVSGGGSGEENGYNIAINPLNNHLFVIGDINLSGGNATFTRMAAGGSGGGGNTVFSTITLPGGMGDLFIVEYTDAGVAVCGSSLVGGGEDATGVAADNFGFAYIAGDFEGVDPFIVGSTSLPFTMGAGQENAYIARWSSCVAVPLGVEWMSFTASCNEGKAKLNWSTASETNNDYFAIERSADGVNYETIGTVKGAGNSSMTTDYTFTDADPVDGISYYRIRQTDYNGNSTVSKIVSYNKNVCGVSVYPNPFDKTLYVSSPTTVNALFRIVNVLGQEVYSQHIFLPGDGTSLAIDLPLLASGMYIVRISDTDNLNLLLNTKVVRAGVAE
ncbi:MAG: T9SS type A sorting domain-containing protein [Bacteroidetes bacterium]|nr:T9SS type A sorting domain-containing protein [Bacteroidota bacterium]